jgi:hypothetical protein
MLTSREKAWAPHIPTLITPQLSNSAGQQQWVTRYNGPGTDDDEPAAIAVDDSGNVYVTGSSLNSPGRYASYTTIKYDAAGQQQWVAR